VKAPGLQTESVAKFYAETLPALGWKRVSPQRFVRGDEQLVVNPEKLRNEGIVRFSLSPRMP
jgi:hypothetical protein